MPSFEFSVSELARNTDLSRLSVYRVLRTFKEWELVVGLPRGERTRFRLNEESPLVEAMYTFNHGLIRRIMGEEDYATLDVTVPLVSLQRVYAALAIGQPGPVDGALVEASPSRKTATIAVA